MKIVKLAKLFYKLLKKAFIPTRMAIPQIQAAMPKIIKAKGNDFAQRYLFLFQEAFKEHDQLYLIIANTLDGKVGIATGFSKKSFDRVAEDAMKTLRMLVDFILELFDDDIKKARIQGRMDSVEKGYQEAFEMYYRYILPKKKPKDKLPITVALSVKFHSNYHGLLDFLLRESYKQILTEEISDYEPFEY